MRVDIANSLGRNFRVAQRIDHAPCGALAAFAGLGNVMRIGAHTETDQLRIDRCTTGLRAFIRFENQHTGSVAHDEPVTILVERTTRPHRLIVTRRQGTRGTESAQ